MSNLPGLIQTVFAVVAILVAAFSALQYQNMKTLRESIGDRDTRIEGLEGRLSDVETQLEHEKSQHAVTKRDLEALGRVVTGEAHWVGIEHRMDDLVGLMTKVMDRMEELVRKVLGRE